jgi:hypothetical protein
MEQALRRFHPSAYEVRARAWWVTSGGWEAVMPDEREFPQCRKCNEGILVPLSDYGREGAPITYKAWVCTNPDCGFNIRIDNGEISFGRTIGQSFK